MQLGISYISSLLKKYGHSTKLLVLSRISGEKNKIIIDNCLEAFKPSVICFTSITTEYDFVAGIAKYIKNKYEHIFLIIGGPHASLNPESVINDNFDALCVGEGEFPTLELIAQLEQGLRPSNIPNLWIKSNFGVQKNLTRQFMQNLNELPFPDREMWQEWIADTLGTRHSILLGRGCPFQCTYCCNHAFKKLAPGKYVRHRSPENIIDEIRDILGKFPETKEIYLEVETITINNQWALDLFSAISAFNPGSGRLLSFGVNIRLSLNMELEKLFAAMEKSNVKFINIGLESGSERIRRDILKRNYSNKDVIDAVKLARRYGLKICFYNMMGIPGETIEDYYETIKINRECLPDWNSNSIFYPYPGTDLYNLCGQNKLLGKQIDTEMERDRAVLDLPGFSRKQIQKSYIWFDYYVYNGYLPIYKLLARVFSLTLRSSPIFSRIRSLIKYFGLYDYARNVLRK
ncbi:B12-binding domain-containing radical SAM protein [Candidatus Saganbacteria bacterium]|nr:B12-binding domain-containing radical SAM protein [Candidatus Saganbacteria bacterium]